MIFSGVSFATFFTLFIVPAVYNLMARGTGSPNAIAHRLDSLTHRARTEPLASRFVPRRVRDIARTVVAAP